jgi:hypothetical protein
MDPMGYKFYLVMLVVGGERLFSMNWMARYLVMLVVGGERLFSMNWMARFK